MNTIVWDVDDVLNDLMYQWLMHGWIREHPECETEYSMLTENPPLAALGATREEYLASLDTFRRSDAGIHLAPNPMVLLWFERHGSQFRHIALTARPLETVPELAAWVMRHFGNWIRCFGVVPTRAVEGIPIYDLGKGDYLRWLQKGDVLVDDTRENLKQAAELGLRVLTWPQPWNDSTQDIADTLNQLTEMTNDID
jgi:hypothetical protein